MSPHMCLLSCLSFIVFIFIVKVPPVQPYTVKCPWPLAYSWTCTCQQSEPVSSYRFANATCDLIYGSGCPDSGKCYYGKFGFLSPPQIDSPSNTYVIEGELIIRTPWAYKIDALAFVAFKSIGHLKFEYVGSKPEAQDWAARAFVNAGIRSLSFSDVSGMWPLPQALVNLGKNGLAGLSITRASDPPFALGANAFADFPTLNQLAIERTTISTINEDAFADLEPRLSDLTLTYAGLVEYPSASMFKLTKLRRLNLRGNGMSQFPRYAFATFRELRELDLSSNNIEPAYDSGLFDNVSATIRILKLDDCAMTKVPTALLMKTPLVVNLSLAHNSISEIRKDDFPMLDKLTELDLDSKSLREIERGSFRNTPTVKLIHLRGTTLESLDLTTFEGAEYLIRLELDRNSVLQTMLASSVEEVPARLKRITVINSALKRIDSNISAIIDRPNFELFDISNNTRLICDANLHWMAKHIFCDSTVDIRLRINGATCLNLKGKPLKDFLHEEASYECPTTTTTTTTRTTRTTTVSSARRTSAITTSTNRSPATWTIYPDRTSTSRPIWIPSTHHSDDHHPMDWTTTTTASPSAAAPASNTNTIVITVFLTIAIAGVFLIVPFLCYRRLKRGRAAPPARIPEISLQRTTIGPNGHHTDSVMIR